ncbi:MAG: hypothetical protein V3T08_09300 [Gemmatimonadota bacterium]
MSTATATRERPILFSGEMVRAILDGRKTQTRRVVTPQPADRFSEPQVGPGWVCVWWRVLNDLNDWHDVRMPFHPGDRLYVRETWRGLHRFHTKSVPSGTYIHYEADGGGDPQGRRGRLGRFGRVRPSIHMPRWASRINLDVTSVRVERVQDATEGDCIAEGMEGVGCDHRYAENGACTDCMNSGWIEPPGLHFKELWDSLNAKRGYSWDTNPWVWVIEFRGAS